MAAPPPDAAALAADLRTMVGDEPQSITSKFLARKHSIHVDVAKAALFAFAEDAGAARVAATYLVAGWTAADPPAHVVRLVAAADVEAARAALAPCTGVHVFAVAPRAASGGAADAASLWAGDAAQEAALFDELVKGGTNALADARCSAVECPGAARDAARAAKAKPASAPPPAPLAVKREAPAGPKLGTVAAAIKKAASRPAAKKAAAAKKAVPAAKKAPAAAADGSDSDGPVVRGGRGGAARLESSDDEEEAGAAAAADPYAEGRTPSASPSPAKRGPAAPPAAAGAAKKRKVTRTVINEAGEEVTEEVWEEVEGDAAPPQPPPPAARKPSPSPAKKPAAKKGAAASKAAAAKGTKNISSFFTKQPK